MSELFDKRKFKTDQYEKLAKTLDDAGIDNYVFASTQVQYEKLEDDQCWEA